MKDNKVLSDIASTLTGKPRAEVTIPIAPRPVPRWKKYCYRLLRKRIPQTSQKHRKFLIYPCKVGNMYRIAGRAALLPEEMRDGTLSAAILPLINLHLKDMVYIIAAGIQNNHQEPEPDLMEFIEENFDAEDLYQTLFPVLENMGMQSFLNSIVLAKGTVNILRPVTSPADGSE